MSGEQKDADLEMLAKHVEQLGEHFDTVQIFCSRHDAGQEDGTVALNDGAGNWFARYGQIREWINKRDERARIEVRDDQ
jgi:hypothetical protein